MAVHVGTSGWSYAHWTDVIYPPGLPPRQRLDHYLPHFQTSELNASYYRWPSDAAFSRWSHRLPAGFLLSVKAPRALTHARRLFRPDQWVARITVSLRQLRTRCGVLLVQLPPALACDHARLAYFLTCLPTWLRVAVEFRNPTWHNEETFALLQQHGAAYCVMSGAHLPCHLRATGDFVYVRLHGPDAHHLYGGSYSDDDLRWWAARIREWCASHREVFVYFNNDGGGNAVRNAKRLKELLAA